MKKKFLAMVIAGVMLVSLVACSNKDKVSESDKSGEITEQRENEDINKDSNSEEIAEYKAFTREEANEFNKKTIGVMEKLINDKGFPAKAENQIFKGSLSEGPAMVGYTGEGKKPYYNFIGYVTELSSTLSKVTYQFYYYVDSEKIKNGEDSLPKSRELLITEPYKIMTGKDISNETLDRIDKLIKETYVEGLINDETLLVTEGPFKVELMLSTSEIGFSITSARVEK